MQARITHLEALLDQRSVDVLNTVLNRQGYTAVGEEEEEARVPVKFGSHFHSLDWKMYANWERDFLQGSPELNREQLQEIWTQENGMMLPSQIL